MTGYASCCMLSQDVDGQDLSMKTPYTGYFLAFLSVATFYTVFTTGMFLSLPYRPALSCDCSYKHWWPFAYTGGSAVRVTTIPTFQFLDGVSWRPSFNRRPYIQWFSSLSS